MRAFFFGGLIAFSVAFLAHYASRKQNWRYLIFLLIGGGILLTICCWLNVKHRTLTILYIGPQSFLAAIFYIIGHLFKCLHISTFKPWQIVIAIVLVLLGSYYWKMGMHIFSYENRIMIPYIVTAVLGTWAVYSLPWSRLTGRAASLMQFIGNNTLTVLTWHLLAFKLVSLLIIFIYGLPIERFAEIPVITNFAQQGWWLVYFFVGLSVSCALAYCNKLIRSPWLKL